MRCTIIAIGPRGDVQPLLAIGAELIARGITVRIATHGDFTPLVSGAGFELFDVGGDAAAFFGGAAGAAVRDRLADAREFRRFFDDYLTLFYERLLDRVAEACRDADAVICWPWTRFASSLSQAFNVPVFIACTYPPMHLPTAAFANPYQPHADAALHLRRSWRRALPALQAGTAALNRWRQNTLGLPAIGWRQDLQALRRLPHLLGYSTAVLPRPADWPSWVHVTGNWFFDAPNYDPPAELAEFLEQGPAIAIGFSSQVTRNPAHFRDVVETGLAQSGTRAILLGGFGALSRIERSDRLLPMASVPHDWLYPRVRAVIHHGGAGSTAGALRAGVPNTAVAFGYDQPLWAERLHAIGVSPPPVAATRLTADSLAAIVDALITSDRMRQRARELSEVLRQEDGAGRAVDVISAALASR